MKIYGGECNRELHSNICQNNVFMRVSILNTENLRADLCLPMHVYYQAFVDIDTILQVIVMNVILITFKKIKKLVLADINNIV